MRSHDNIRAYNFKMLVGVGVGVGEFYLNVLRLSKLVLVNVYAFYHRKLPVENRPSNLR